MKYIFFTIAAVFLTVSCQKENRIPKEEASVSDKETKAVAATDLNTPDVDIALNFINGYIDNLKQGELAAGVVEWIAANPLATDNYKAALKKEYDDAEMLDADLVFDAQDYDDKGMEVASADKEGYVVLRGISWKDFKVVLKLVKQEGKWLVDGCGGINIPEDKRLQR